jgi:hypothetical protein
VENSTFEAFQFLGGLPFQIILMGYWMRVVRLIQRNAKASLNMLLNSDLFAKRCNSLASGFINGNVKDPGSNKAILRYL